MCVRTTAASGPALAPPQIRKTGPFGVTKNPVRNGVPNADIAKRGALHDTHKRFYGKAARRSGACPPHLTYASRKKRFASKSKSNPSRKVGSVNFCPARLGN
jgi:hypothetical protein